MIELVTSLRRSKTFWLAVAGLAGVGEEYARGALTAHQAAAAALVCLLAITQRHATERLARDR